MSSEQGPRPLPGMVHATSRYDLTVEAAKRTDARRRQLGAEIGLGTPIKRRESRDLADDSAEAVDRIRVETGLASERTKGSASELNKPATI